MAQPRATGVIVANRSRPIPQQESAQSRQYNSLPVETSGVSISLPPVLSTEQSQSHPKSLLHDAAIDALTEALNTVGNDWKKWRGDECFLASRRGVLLTLAADQAGEVVLQKERIAKEGVPPTIIKQPQGHSQLVGEMGLDLTAEYKRVISYEMDSVEQCKGRREEAVLPLLATFPSPQLLTSLFIIEKAEEGFIYRSRHCLSLISSSMSTSCSSCDDFFDNLASLEGEHHVGQNVRGGVSVQPREASGIVGSEIATDTLEDETGWEGDVSEYDADVKSLKLEKKIDHGVKRKRRPPNEQFSCNLCEQTFRLHGGLTRHIRKVHQIESRGLLNVKADATFPCPHCNTSFANQAKLQSHLRTVHDENGLEKRLVGPEEVPCPFCKDTFPVIGGRSSSHRLRHHLTTVHAKLSEMREFKDLMEEQLETVICAHCGKSYSNQATLNSHVKLMHSEQAELEACHICGKRFKKGGSTLWGHIRTHEDGGHVCPICGAKFKVKSYLQRHVKSHDPGSKKYECDICGDKFTRPYLVLQHQEFTHRKNLPFKCPECGKCLRSKTFLKIHLRSVHSKEKPFPCEVCGFRSSRVDNLNIHRIKVHNLTTKVTRQSLKVLVEEGGHPFCATTEQIPHF